MTCTFFKLSEPTGAKEVTVTVFSFDEIKKGRREREKKERKKEALLYTANEH